MGKTNSLIKEFFRRSRWWSTPNRLQMVVRLMVWDEDQKLYVPLTGWWVKFDLTPAFSLGKFRSELERIIIKLQRRQNSDATD